MVASWVQAARKVGTHTQRETQPLDISAADFEDIPHQPVGYGGLPEHHPEHDDEEHKYNGPVGIGFPGRLGGLDLKDDQPAAHPDGGDTNGNGLGCPQQDNRRQKR